MKRIIWKNWVNAFLGIFVFILPVLGFPRGMKSFLSSISGLAIFSLSFLLAKKYSTHDVCKKGTDEIPN